jgi:drug/metabolite transporter (DMT)-like permease
MTHIEKAMLPPAPVAPTTLPVLGLLVGLCAASIGAIYTVFARYGIQHGMTPWDLTFLRFAVAGLLTLPIFFTVKPAQWANMQIQWRIWLAIALLAGPLFGLLMFGALYLAPASHAAVFPFAAMSIMGLVMASTFLGDVLTARKGLGIAVVIAGLLVLAGLSVSSLQGKALLGDALFVIAGTFWAGFGILLRKYKLPPLLATAVISLFALLTYVPVYLLATHAQNLLTVDSPIVVIEVLVQGVLAGGGTLYTYATMVRLLGPARAAVFPALAPGIAALLAWPVLGHLPSSHELIGLVMVICGLLVSVTTFRLFPHSFKFLSRATS